VRLENLWRVLADDGLPAEVARALNSVAAGRAYLAGTWVPDALSGAVPEGVMVVCEGDPVGLADAIASRIDRRRVSLRRRPGVQVLVPTSAPRPQTDRPIVIVAADGDIEAHLRSAGFTVQALAVEVGADHPPLIDPTGGLEDLRGAVLKEVSPGRPVPDPVSVLSAVELSSRYRLEVDEATAQRLEDRAPGLAAADPVRVWAALARLMGGDGVAAKARALKRFGALDALFPELAATFGIPQNYYHHLGVWEHTIEVIEILERILAEPAASFHVHGARLESHLRQVVEGGIARRAFLFFAALVHDVGKAETMTVTESGRIRFGGHQQASARLVRGMAGRLLLGRRGGSHLVGLVAEHMRLGFLMKEGESTATRLGVIRELGSRTPDVAVLSLADRMATSGEASTVEGLERYERLVKRIIDDYFWDRHCPELVTGREVIVHAGVPPGPEVSKRLFNIRVAQRESIVSNRQQALEYLAPDFKGRMR
jgi:hypothetical protein